MFSTSLCYIERGGEYLMLHRVKKEKDINKDKWIGVGGKFLEGESPEDCMRREMLEETGLVAQSWRYRGIVTFVPEGGETEFMHLFTVSEFSGEPKECDEGELAWIEKSRLPLMDIWEGDRIFLRLLEENAPFFSLKLCYRGSRLVKAVLNGEELKEAQL